MKPNHSRYANTFRFILILTLMLLLLLPVSTASASASPQDLPEPDPPTDPLTTDLTIAWNTFLGSTDLDYGTAIAVDRSGNVYITGYSDGTWGSPINAHAGGVDPDGNLNPDAFVAKLDSSGVLQWNTFLGSTDWDHGNAIVVDRSGNVYVVGSSDTTWGSPLNSFTGGVYGELPLPPREAFIAKLDSSGVLQWNTFLGSKDLDESYAIAVDGSGDIYVSGVSHATWGSPLNPHGRNNYPDAFIAKLDSSGALQWNTFFGSTEVAVGKALAVDSNGNVYLAGYSVAPPNAPSYEKPTGKPTGDAFVAKLNSEGIFQWKTFFGSTAEDFGNDIAVDGSGNVYLTGYSVATWGSPLNAHAAGVYSAGNPTPDSFAAKLNSDGVLQWNTFFGSTEWDEGSGIAVDCNGNVYLTGYSVATWGSPHNAHAGGVGSAGNPNSDSFVAKLNRDGALQWNTFFGSTEWDSGRDIALDGSGNVYLTGYSTDTWGSPLNVHSGDEKGDIFVVQFSDPELDVLGQGTDTPDLSWIYWCAVLFLGVCLAILLKYNKRLSKSR